MTRKKMDHLHLSSLNRAGSVLFGKHQRVKFNLKRIQLAHRKSDFKLDELAKILEKSDAYPSGIAITGNTGAVEAYYVDVSLARGHAEAVTWVVDGSNAAKADRDEDDFVPITALMREVDGDVDLPIPSQTRRSRPLRPNLGGASLAESASHHG